jgi:primary-amine oxidase
MARHPLDPLTAEEIRAATGAVRAAHPDLERPAFAVVALLDPPKAAVVAGTATERRARLVVLERGTGTTYEAVVDVAEPRVESWGVVPHVQPPIMPEELELAARAARADPRFAEALRRRGIADDEEVQIDPLAAGSYDHYPAGRRLLWATPYRLEGENAYARPIENVRALVDPSRGEVLEVVDGDVVPFPTVSAGFDERPEELAPLHITQPDGPGFTLDGHELSWQGWRLHAALHPIDGLVLSDVRLHGRHVLHRAALAELVVAYGDPHDGYYWRSSFDLGEHGMGRAAASLSDGGDCVGESRYLDATLADAAGEPWTIANAISVQEEDAGLLYKHRERVRRSRRLVVSSVSTIRNCDYAFHWSFHRDGTIELEVGVTGVVPTRAVTPEEPLRHARRIAPDLAAPHHQHLFSVRLDMAVDGFHNRVYEVDMIPCAAGPENLHGGATELRETLIARERDGRRMADPLRSRRWKVAGEEGSAYTLIPHLGPLLLAHPDSSVARRAGFARAHLWVTRYAADELHAAGDYPNQAPGGAGLETYVAHDRDLVDADVVLWHTFGTARAVRPEDWPLRPVERIGFALQPTGFFDRNPGL